MTRLRVIIFIISIIVVAGVATLLFQYARGYRLNEDDLTIMPSGLLVANSEPNGAQVFVDNELKTATNNTLSLLPGSYSVEIKKEGFLSWRKQLEIEKEVVTQVDVNLFTSAPSLSALTFSGASRPVATDDFSKIAYAVAGNGEAQEKQGLWVIEATNLPIGFSRDPRRITDGDMSEYLWEWSPDGRQILLIQGELETYYLLDVSQFTPAGSRQIVTTTVEELKDEWLEQENKRIEAKLAKLPDELEEEFSAVATDIVFSPDENMILYTATESATITEGLIKELPGSSTQEQTRGLQEGYKYVFDIKEDRNFEVGSLGEIIHWFPTSRHLVVPMENKIVIKDYDNTNQMEVYSGSYTYPYAYPYSSTSKIMILTNLGAADSEPDLYSLNLR